MLLDAFEEITVVPDDLQSIWAADQERGLGHDAVSAFADENKAS